MANPQLVTDRLLIRPMTLDDASDLAERRSDPATAELGFTLHPWARGQGFATEASKALLAYGFTDWGVHRFEASCHPGNIASSRVLATLGFRYEGTSIESYWVGDVVSDDAHYALLHREWERHESVS